MQRLQKTVLIEKIREDLVGPGLTKKQLTLTAGKSDETDSKLTGRGEVPKTVTDIDHGGIVQGMLPLSNRTSPGDLDDVGSRMGVTGERGRDRIVFDPATPKLESCRSSPPPRRDRDAVTLGAQTGEKGRRTGGLLHQIG